MPAASSHFRAELMSPTTDTMARAMSLPDGRVVIADAVADLGKVEL